MVNIREFIDKAKREYRRIGHVECPAFNNEKIYFTNKGFIHLIKKDRKYRNSNEQKRRLGLLPYVATILKTSNRFHSYRVTEKQYKTKKGIINSTAHFWSFIKIRNNKHIIIVICQINKEPKHFISVMDRN